MSQFSKSDTKSVLADYIDIPKVYPAGRLDYDSEGLLLLTDDGKLQNKIASPQFNKSKIYWAQLEGNIDIASMQKFCKGLELKDGLTRPAKIRKMEEFEINNILWPRNPPIRERKAIPTSWVEITLSEGKNRQVRRMTAAIGFPTLRLIRTQIGPYKLDGLKPGEYRIIDG